MPRIITPQSLLVIRLLLLSQLTLVFSINSYAMHCSVSADNLDFGHYQPFSGNDSLNTNNIYLNCRGIFNSNSTYQTETPNNTFAFVQIFLSTGNSGSYSNRKLYSGVSYLNYNLYTNSRRSRIWGDGTGGSRYVIETVRSNHPSVVKIYGKIPTSQQIPPGAYTDNIIITIQF